MHHQPNPISDHTRTCPPCYPGHDNPQLVLTEPGRSDSPHVCDSCGQPIARDVERWELTTGLAPRTERHAVAHPDTSDETGDGGPCYDRIRETWAALAQDAGAGLIVPDPATGYWTLHGEDLHCGTPVEGLLGGGVWTCGSYEILDGARGPVPAVAVALGGLNRPAGMLTIPTSALVRPGRPRR